MARDLDLRKTSSEVITPRLGFLQLLDHLVSLLIIIHLIHVIPMLRGMLNHTDHLHWQQRLRLLTTDTQHQLPLLLLEV